MKNEGIKVLRCLCYITMGILYCVSLIIILYGYVTYFASAEDIFNQQFSSWVIILGIISFFLTTLSIAPILAIVEMANQKAKQTDLFGEFINVLKNPQTKHTPYHENTFSSPKPTIIESNIDELKKAIDFINSEYHIYIESHDDLNTMKEKIQSIDSQSHSVQIFKNRIHNTESIAEVLAIIKIHRTAKGQ